ncbi:hypothetical protein L1049_009356 [Liquidambar formosana]|uniref:Uncharacterized protein n=1 Tax=Liquidambar formosana TaxID=63359 RepID=A0AAP0S591_LIQFO
MSDLRQRSHAKSSVFSTISFAALFLFVIFVNFICNLSLGSLVFRTKESIEVLYNGISQQQLESISTKKHTRRSQQQLEPTSSRIPLRLIKTEIKEGHSEDQNNQNSPFSVTNKGRINTRRSQQHLVPTSTKIPLLPIKEEMKEGNSEEDQNNLNPPFNLTKEERIAWFNKKFPEFEILKSTKLTQQFDARVKEFFKHKCKGQFFMTWIATAKVIERVPRSHRYNFTILLPMTFYPVDWAQMGNFFRKPKKGQIRDGWKQS